jgi:hypothetical protein
MYCFPGQTIELAAINGGNAAIGIEAFFRFQVWKVPRIPTSTDVDKAIKAVGSNLEAYLIDRSPGATPEHTAMFYVYLDAPAFGTNKINILETRPDVVYNLEKEGDNINGDHRYSSGNTYDYIGEKVVGKFGISKGYIITAEITIENRS